MKYCVPVFLCLFLSLSLAGLNQSYGQDPIADEETFDERYARNIKKSRINGVYIPSDIEDALVELKALSSEASLKKFMHEEERTVCRKLHFGIGRWMIYNWNFYEGSRISHLFKEKGITHPDDIAQILLISLHMLISNIISI